MILQKKKIFTLFILSRSDEKSKSIIETMKEINQNGTTIVIGIHDYSIKKTS